MGSPRLRVLHGGDEGGGTRGGEGSVSRSVYLLQLGLQGLEVADGLLQGRVGAQRLQLHQVAADVVQAHVGEAAPEVGGRRRSEFRSAPPHSSQTSFQ